MLFPKVQFGMWQSNDPTLSEVKLQCLLMPVIHGGRFLAEHSLGGKQFHSCLSSGTPQKRWAVFIPHAAAAQVVPVGCDIPRTSFPGCRAVAQHSEPVPGLCDSLPLIFTCYLKQSRRGALLLFPCCFEGVFLPLHSSLPSVSAASATGRAAHGVFAQSFHFDAAVPSILSLPSYSHFSELLNK